MLGLLAKFFRSSDVACGVGSLSIDAATGAEGVRRCLVRYEAERGNEGREVGAWWMDGLRLLLGDAEADVAGDRCDGGVYGIPMNGRADRLQKPSRDAKAANKTAAEVAAQTAVIGEDDSRCAIG
jgi:hypothetical protein